MEQWLQHRHIFLDEQLRCDGLGEVLDGLGLCADCSNHPGQLRCQDCSGGFMYCSTCMVSSHQRLPLHRIQVCRVSPTILTRINPISSLGMGSFLKMQPSKVSDSSSTPPTSAQPVQKPDKSLSSTFPATILSVFNFARVLTTHLWNLTANS